MLQVSWEAAAIIGIASFVNMIILAYLIRSKITKVYTDVERKVTKSITHGLASSLDEVGGKLVKSGVNAVKLMYPQMKEDMMDELGALAGEGIEKMFMKLKMSTMGALGGAAMHDKKLVGELGSILKEEIMPALAGASNNPLLSFIMKNERIQGFLESNPDALPLIQQFILPMASKFGGGDGNTPQGVPSQGASTFGRPL